MIYATYDTATRKILGWHSTEPVPDEGRASHSYDGEPPLPTMQGWMFDANFNVVAYGLDLPTAQRQKTDEAWRYFDGLMRAGFTYSGALYQIDTAAQAQIAAMGVMALGSITDPVGSPWPAGFYWIAADNSHVPMDAATMYGFGRAAAAYVSACVLRLRAIEDAIAAAPDQPTLDAIDVTAGYPQASA